MNHAAIDEPKPYGEPVLFDELLALEEEEDFQEEADPLAEDSEWVDASFDTVSSDYQYDATRLYLKELSRSQLLTAEEEKHYGRLALKGDPAARKKMIESNLRLVVKISRRYLNRGYPFWT